MSANARVRVAVAAALFVALVVAGWRMGGAHGTAVRALYTLLCIPAFLRPALQIEGFADLRRRWRDLTAWFVVWTLVWDAATALLGRRPFLSEWYLVYLSGPVTLFALLALHLGLVALVSRLVAGRPQR